LLTHNLCTYAPGAFYFVNTLVKFIETTDVEVNMYNTNPLKEVGWVISTMFFVDSIMVYVCPWVWSIIIIIIIVTCS